MASTIFNPTADTFIGPGDSEDTNYGDFPAILVYNANNSPSSGLFKFDIHSIADTITDAYLDLTLSPDFIIVPATNPVGFVLQRGTQAWVELEATWDIYSVGHNWTTAGGDFAAPIVSSGTYQVGGTTLRLPGLAAAAIDAIQSRSGILNLIMSQPLNDNSLFGWYSRDIGDPNLRPKLTIVHGTTSYKPWLHRSRGFGVR